jgi:hypothetical protein
LYISHLPGFIFGIGRPQERPTLKETISSRHRLELLDESVGVSGSGAYQCFALENLAGADADRVLVLAAYKDFLTLLLKQAEHPKLQ